MSKELELKTLTQEIAKSLGPEWEYKAQVEPNYCQYIKNKTTPATLLVTWTLYDKTERVSISGSLNVGKDRQYVTVYAQGGHRDNFPDISVAVERGTDVIAKEITRRFLPEYTRVLGRALAQVQKEADYDNVVFAHTTRLAKAAGQEDKRSKGRVGLYQENGVYGDVKVYADSASLDLHNLTIEQAEYILRYIKKESNG